MQSRIIYLCFCTALISYSSTFNNEIKDTYLLFASLFARNLPKILIPRVFNDAALSIAIIVLTFSYNTAFAAFFVEVILFTTWAKISLISSLINLSRLPNNRKN